MTVTDITPVGNGASPEERAELAALVGETVAALLPADDSWSSRLAEGAALPEGATSGVGCRAAGHTVVLVASAAMDRRIQVGPPPADGLLDGAAPALEAVTEALGLGPAGDIEPIAPGAVAGVVTADAVVCALDDGGEHQLTVIVVPPAHVAASADAVAFEPIVGSGATGGLSGLEVLHDVEMGVTVELGRTVMAVRDILAVVPGSVIELDRPASAPVDVLVNGTLIARGEVVVIDEEFGIRITEIVGHDPTGHGVSHA